MTYQEKKAKYAYGLYLKGLPFKKVYAAVEKDGKFLVLKDQSPERLWPYSLSGGGVDEGESNEQAIKRELLEELNVNVEIVKSLGSFKYMSKRRYKDFEFDLECVAEIFYTKFISYGKNNEFGLAGEFDSRTAVAEISKQELLEGCYEFGTKQVSCDF